MQALKRHKNVCLLRSRSGVFTPTSLRSVLVCTPQEAGNVPSYDSNKAIGTKIFIGFVATIIRNRIYTLLKDEAARLDKKPNFMTVSIALKELKKIELLKGADNEYTLDYAVTATKKTILKAFGMTADSIRRQARTVSSDLMRIETEAFKKQAAAQEERSK